MSDARDVIRDGLATPGRACVTSSFQAEDVVLVHMLRETNPDIPVLFLDTFHHFPETLRYRDEIAATWQLNLVNLRASEPSVGLWQRDSTRRGSRVSAASSRRRAHTSRRSNRSSCPRARCCAS
jgi:3'-phosphoadenosine 5'-phosphosulfate sulfotransferase (PAPS reductase)/FAD synthetase